MSQTQSFRELVYYVAISVDHYIAQQNHQLNGFLETGSHIDDFWSHIQKYDTVLMGRKTYEAGYAYGLKPGELAYPGKQHIVFSRHLKPFQTCHTQLKIENRSVSEVVQALKKTSGGPIWLCGGGHLAAQLLHAELIDRIILKINPFIMGAGIPLFSGTPNLQSMKLEQSQTFDSGVVVLNYTLNTN